MAQQVREWFPHEPTRNGDRARVQMSVRDPGSPGNNASAACGLGCQSGLAAALSYVEGHRWAEAQRTLETLLRSGRNPQAEQYLAEIRAIRRCLRQLRKWSRDASLHLELGWLYFGLELGGDAAQAFGQAVALEPKLASAHYGLALEYLFEGKVAAARRASARACALNNELPSFGELERTLERSGR